MSPMPDMCEITEVIDKSPFSPIIVDFEYGHKTAREISETKCDIYVDPKNNLKKRVIVSSKNQYFTGKIPSDEESLCKTLLLIRNKETNEARLISTQSCRLVNSSIEEEKENRKRKATEIIMKKTVGENAKRESFNALTQTFGSKRSKRANEISLRMNVNMSGKEEDIKQAIADVDVKLNELDADIQGVDDIMKLLPKCNRAAKTREEVYSIDNLITEAERNSLKSAAEFLAENSLTSVDEKSSYFLYTHYLLLGKSPDIEKITLLLYANSLLKFFNIPASELNKKSVASNICPQSFPVAKRILNEFTVLIGKLRRRPNAYKDKVICHIMVIILLVCDFKVNIETLSSCFMGFGQKKLLLLGRVVGLVSLGKGQTSKEYVLKVPLPQLPTVRQPRRKT